VIPDDWQAQAMNYIGRGGRLLSVRAGHGVGKSAFCAWLVLWHIVVHPIQKTVLTAPTQGQLFDALFAECKFWLKRMPEFIRTRFEPQAEKIVLRGEAESNFVSARTSSKEKPEALAGVHSEEGSVLLIADEASAIPEEVYEAATGSMSGRTAHTILISNPTRNSGLFYNTHHGLKIDATADAETNVGRWQTMHVSCLNSKRADPAFVKQIIETYGLDSNQYRVRVLGEFATREDDVLIPAVLIDAAVKRDIQIDPLAPMIYGLDIARFGDDRTVLLKRRGNVVVEIKWWQKEDTMATVGRVMHEAALDGGKEGIEVCADVIGVGAGVCDRLRELGFDVRDVNVSEASAMNPSASRLRDDLWLQARDWFTAGACKIPDHERLKADLKAPTYSFASNGKVVVEPKAMMKRRKLPSPDFADALCLTFAGTAAMVGGRMSAWKPGAPLRRNMRGVV
jgi:phage terminase large subunit